MESTSGGSHAQQLTETTAPLHPLRQQVIARKQVVIGQPPPAPPRP